MGMPKYKAWDKIGKRMFDVRSIDFFGKVAQLEGNGQSVLDCLQCPNIECFAPFYKLDRLNLLRYAERKDINGIEIYENYIVEFEINGKPNISEVEFVEGCFVVYESLEFHPCLCDVQKIKVVGDIWKNPELLEGKAKC
jgi:hypothetical protein